ncbi:MAG: acyl carrier protein [Clostridiaceae bacterium BRH_c20a]|nr:MAG: acyl carrier protein [Clostridiaceae bacterium BRH_c20a]
MTDIEKIKQVIKEDILINRLELEDIKVEDIEDNTPLFGEGLGLDSVEALDVVAGLEQFFGVKLQGVSPQEFQKHLYSVENLAQFVVAKGGKIAS